MKNGENLETFPSTLSRKLARNIGTESDYNIASRTGEQADRLRLKPRRALKLAVGNLLFEIVKGYLKENWLPEQTAGTLQCVHSDNPEQRISHETIYHIL